MARKIASAPTSLQGRKCPSTRYGGSKLLGHRSARAPEDRAKSRARPVRAGWASTPRRFMMSPRMRGEWFRGGFGVFRRSRRKSDARPFGRAYMIHLRLRRTPPHSLRSGQALTVGLYIWSGPLDRGRSATPSGSVAIASHGLECTMRSESALSFGYSFPAHAFLSAHRLPLIAHLSTLPHG